MFVYISIIAVSSNVNFVNNNSNHNLSNFIDFSNCNNLLCEPNIYNSLYHFDSHRVFISESPPESNGIKELEGTNLWIISILWFLLWFKIKKRPFLSFVFTIIIVIFISFNLHMTNNRMDEDLHFCSRRDFFTHESINISNDINQAYLRGSLNFFTLSKLKFKNIPSFFKHILLLSGDISLNPGPIQSQLNNDIWSPFKRRGLHFIHLNINSILPKIDEFTRHSSKI